MEYIHDELVGFDDDAERLIDILTRGPRELDVISIVGIAGVGKTALARKVYCSTTIRNYFDVHAWCSISQTYDRRKLLCEILEQVTGYYAFVKYPADSLRKSLRIKRHLIVLDDIWSVNAWDDLRGCFYDVGNGSRILLTTRVTKVAQHINPDRNPYFLSFLKDKQSWELLQRKVFRGETCPPELLNVGRLVAEKCKGLPSLIIMIAGIISKKEMRDPNKWLEVAYDISSHALEEESMKMIQLSYNGLEDHLKGCLLYLGLFPKDYEIPVSDLLKWWIAEDFVHDIDTLKLEEISKSCLNDLVSSNLVMVSKRRTDGEMKYCKVLDQVREFCLTKITEEKYMQLIVPYNPDKKIRKLKVPYEQEEVIVQYYSDELLYQPLYSDLQRLCMYINHTMKSDKIPTLVSKERESFGHHQGSLEFIAHPKFSISDRKNLFPLLNNLRLIRVLYLLDIKLQDSWPTAFQSLTQLRYLAIFVKAFDIKWVLHLLHLQNLRVRSSFIMISPAIWKMKKLRHVDISEFSIGCKDNEQVNSEASSAIVLDNLKTLGMCYMSVADMTQKFWGKFPNLEELRLHINEFGDVPNRSDGYGRYINFPSSLKVLSLSEIFLTEEIVSSIAGLEYLETLKLSEIYFTGEKTWDLNDNVFEKLNVLKLHCVFMTQWHFSEETFPELKILVIKGCSKLEEIPLSLAESQTLRLIKVIDCS